MMINPMAKLLGIDDKQLEAFTKRITEVVSELEEFMKLSSFLLEKDKTLVDQILKELKKDDKR